MSRQRTSMAPLVVLAITSVVAACGGSAPVASTPSVPPSSAPPVGATSATAGASSSAAASGTPTVLRIATVEGEDTPEGRAIAEFSHELEQRTKGSVTVLPIFETADGDPVNIEGVQTGLIDMAITQARAWDEFGVTSMQALQTPFLLATEDAAIAATSGPLATRLMAGLDDQDVVGLMLWPIDLRHFVSFKQPILEPKDVAGKRVRIIGSTINEQVVTALGGTPVGEYFDDSVEAGESAFDREYSLPGPGTFTGNVTLYPRIDLMFISSASFEGLSPDQQTALREAADATRELLVKDIVPDAVQAAGYCKEHDGSVALSSAEQVKAFQEALAPVEATITADATSKALVEDLRTMAGKLPAPATAVEACSPA